MKSFFYSEVAVPIIEERIHKKPFAFNLLNILPKCRQAKLIFSSFTESSQMIQAHIECGNVKSPNLLLLDSLFDQLQVLNDQSLYMNENDSKSFFELLLTRQENRPTTCKYLKSKHNSMRLGLTPLKILKHVVF